MLSLYWCSVVNAQVKGVLDDMLEKLPEEYNLAELMCKTADRTPYILVCLQECQRMNLLLAEIHRSLKELDFGLKVQTKPDRKINIIMNSFNKHNNIIVFFYHELPGKGRTESFFRHGDAPDGSVLWQRSRELEQIGISFNQNTGPVVQHPA